MELCRFAVREGHVCFTKFGDPVHGDQVCHSEAMAQLCDERALDARTRRPFDLAGKDRAAGR